MGTYYTACIERFDGKAWRFVCYWWLPKEYELVIALDNANCGIEGKSDLFFGENALNRLSSETYDFFAESDVRNHLMRVASSLVCSRLVGNKRALSKNALLMLAFVQWLGKDVGPEKVRLVFWSDQ
jgi:hypothetical protein